jgi:hypothetical protein
MIRDCGELLFYIDYVHQLVKDQDAFNNKNIVFVDVYLTGGWAVWGFEIVPNYVNVLQVIMGSKQYRQCQCVFTI